MGDITFGSLFSGIGGFDLGFERAGMKCSWQVEIDKNCQKLLKNKFGVNCYGDIREVKGSELEPVDVICGGFPCQDLSIAGSREGLAGERSGLWFEYARILRELTPAWVIIENVPGLLSSHGGRDFAAILRWLAECGYLSTWRVLDSQFFGLAQRRKRVFIVGSLRSGRSAEVLFEREGVRWNPPPRRKERKENTGVSGTLSANGGGVDRPAGNANELDFCVSFALTAKGGSGRNDLTNDQFVPSDIGVRRLMPVECERLQGFPGGWTEGFSDTVRYKMLGNAVSVPVAEWIGKRIIEHG
jgi:DNA (cytosine-5)-methyltransferase 1